MLITLAPNDLSVELPELHRRFSQTFVILSGGHWRSERLLLGCNVLLVS